jgi:hypothetical protein
MRTGAYAGCVRTRSANLSPFGEMLTELCVRARTTLYEAGLRIGIKDRGAMSRATRPHRNGQRSRLLSIDQMRRIAEVLHCSREEAYRLVLLGALEYAPDLVGTHVERIEEELSSANKKLGRPNPRYTLPR